MAARRKSGGSSASSSASSAASSRAGSQLGLTEATTIRAGTLVKTASSGFASSKPRFFVLRQTPAGAVLTYYASKESGKERARLLVSDVIMVQASDPRDRISFGGQVALHEFGVGVIKYFGPCAARGVGDWVGVELFRPTGNTDGSVADTRYFTCKPNHGVFVSPGDLMTVAEYSSLGDMADKRKSFTFTVSADPSDGDGSRSSLTLTSDSRSDLIAWMLCLDPHKPQQPLASSMPRQGQVKRISGLTYDETPDDFEAPDDEDDIVEGDDDDDAYGRGFGSRSGDDDVSYLEVAGLDDLEDEEESEYLEIGPDGFEQDSLETSFTSLTVQVAPLTNYKEQETQAARVEGGPTFEEMPLWRNQPHVIKAQVFEKLSKTERRRQETIFELSQTEGAYLRDVMVLKKILVLPLEAHARSCEFSGTEPILPLPHIQRLGEVVMQLEQASRGFLAALRKRQQAAPVVRVLSDVVLDWSSQLCQAFYDYCELLVEIRAKLDSPQSALRALLASMMQDPAARNLPIDAFILTPVQRLARYPLLLQAVVGTTEYTFSDYDPLQSAQTTMAEAVQRCNKLMCKMQDEMLLRAIEATLDFGRIASPLRLVKPGRSLVKRGLLDVLTLSGKRISKYRALEFFLFTDLVMFAKPLKHKKTGTLRYLVFKQVHRSHFEAKDHPDLSKGKGDQAILEMLIFEQHQTLRLYTRAPSSTDKTRWLEAFNPPKTEDQVYFEWDCPKAKIVQDYDARQRDEMSLRSGEVINILARGTDGWNKGALTHTTPDLNRSHMGWYPVECTQEIESEHAAAKLLKSMPSMKVVADGKSF